MYSGIIFTNSFACYYTSNYHNFKYKMLHTAERESYQITPHVFGE